MRAYVLVLMSVDRFRSLKPRVTLIATVTGMIIICLLSSVALTHYTEMKLYGDESHSTPMCIQEYSRIIGFVSHP